MTKQEQSFEMARRLKDLREERNLSHDKLKAALLEQFGITISRDSLMSYEIQTEPHSKIKNGKYPNLNMGVEYLNALAQFYGVSTDYLLGLSDKPTIDPQAAGAAEYTGLSLEAIKKLHLLHIANSHGLVAKGYEVNYIGLLSELIEADNDFYDLCAEISYFMVYGGALPQEAYTTQEDDLSLDEWERFHRWANGRKQEIVSRDEARELHLQLAGEKLKGICRSILEKTLTEKNEVEENGQH